VCKEVVLRGMSEENHVFHQDRMFPGRDANPEPPNYDAMAWVNRVLISDRGKRYVRTCPGFHPVSSVCTGVTFPEDKATGA
jgi:hypothetical protein